LKATGIQLTAKDLSILHIVNDCELGVFSIDEMAALATMPARQLKESLARLVLSGSLSRVERGMYCPRNFRNSYSIATSIVGNSAIAYWSALNLHGLTEQIPNVVFVQSCNRKTDKSIFGVRYRFIQIKSEAFTGIIRMGFGNEEFSITDIEKTLLDCFCMPDYSGGYAELLRAFYTSKPDALKLLEYGKNAGNLSVLKRMAYLSELWGMEGFNDFRSEVLPMVNDRYTLLDPLGKNEGGFVGKWRIRVNIGMEKLNQIKELTY